MGADGQARDGDRADKDSQNPEKLHHMPQGAQGPARADLDGKEGAAVAHLGMQSLQRW